MNSERLLQSFIDMTKIESPSFHEAEMAAYCIRELESMGFDVVVDDTAVVTGSDTGNVIAFLPGNASGRVAFCSHMDTVQPCEGIVAEVVTECVDGIECEIVRSCGETILSADDKSGIAAIFEGVRSTLEANAPRPDITVALTVAEEVSLVGASALAHGALGNGTHCFVLDADGAPGSIIAGAPYHYSFKAAFKGLPAHAGVAPETGHSAIEAAAAAITKMPLGRLDEATTSNIGMISGGIAVNIVAEDCMIEGECRSLAKDKVEDVKASITRAIEEGAAQADCTVELEWTLDYPGVMFGKDDEIVRRLVSAIESVGLTPRITTSGGGADANVLSTKGACAITLGTGMTNFHSKDEFIKVADLEGCAMLVEALIAEYAD